MIRMCRKCRKCLELLERNRNARGGYCWMCRRPEILPPTKQPVEPTQTEPGSVERMMILAMRAASGEHLFHPDDKSNRQTATELPSRQLVKHLNHESPHAILLDS